MTRMPWEVTREMFLDEADVRRLLKSVRERVRAVSGRRRAAARLDQLIIEGLLFSGLRNSEFCRLALADTPTGHGQSAFVVRGLGGDDRTVFIPKGLDKLVRGYVRDVRPLFLPEGVRHDDLRQPLIFSERRQPFERTGLYRRVVKVLTAANLQDRASVQLLRHTYGYLAYLKTGGNLLFAQRQLGHSHPMVTVVYARFVNESYADMADLIQDCETSRGTPKPTRALARKGR